MTFRERLEQAEKLVDLNRLYLEISDLLIKHWAEDKRSVSNKANAKAKENLYCLLYREVYKKLVELGLNNVTHTEFNTFYKKFFKNRFMEKFFFNRTDAVVIKDANTLKLGDFTKKWAEKTTSTEGALKKVYYRLKKENPEVSQKTDSLPLSTEEVVHFKTPTGEVRAGFICEELSDGLLKIQTTNGVTHKVKRGNIVPPPTVKVKVKEEMNEDFNVIAKVADAVVAAKVPNAVVAKKIVATLVPVVKPEVRKLTLEEKTVLDSFVFNIIEKGVSAGEKISFKTVRQELEATGDLYSYDEVFYSVSRVESKIKNAGTKSRI